MRETTCANWHFPGNTTVDELMMRLMGAMEIFTAQQLEDIKDEVRFVRLSFSPNRHFLSVFGSAYRFESITMIIEPNPLYSIPSLHLT